ncbi:hypothetical protein VTK56DRAFT_9020 [Thermocarpiscus australiensis]
MRRLKKRRELENPPHAVCLSIRHVKQARHNASASPRPPSREPEERSLRPACAQYLLGYHQSTRPRSGTAWRNLLRCPQYLTFLLANMSRAVEGEIPEPNVTPHTLCTLLSAQTRCTSSVIVGASRGSGCTGASRNGTSSLFGLSIRSMRK